MLHRKMSALPALVLTSAVLLAGCSSSPEAAKRATEAEPPTTATTAPAGEGSRSPGGDATSAEDSEPLVSDKAPTTMWVPSRAAPSGDELAGVDTSDASAEQAAEIDDRDVTLEEYEAAFDRFSECMAAAGFELGNGHFYDDRYHYSVPSDAVDDGADQECYRAEFFYVDMLWQVPDAAPRPSD